MLSSCSSICRRRCIDIGSKFLHDIRGIGQRHSFIFYVAAQHVYVRNPLALSATLHCLPPANPENRETVSGFRRIPQRVPPESTPRVPREYPIRRFHVHSVVTAIRCTHIAHMQSWSIPRHRNHLMVNSSRQVGHVYSSLPLVGKGCEHRKWALGQQTGHADPQTRRGRRW